MFLKEALFNFPCAYLSPGNLFKGRFSEFWLCPRQSLRFCISKKFLHDADIANPRTTLWEWRTCHIISFTLAQIEESIFLYESGGGALASFFFFLKLIFFFKIYLFLFLFVFICESLKYFFDHIYPTGNLTLVNTQCNMTYYWIVPLKP